MKNYKKKKNTWYHISPNNLETNCILTICKGWQICTERQTLVFYWGIKSSNLENDLKSSRKTDDVHIKLFYNSAPIYPVEKLLYKCTEKYTRLLEHKTDGHIKSLNCLKKTQVTNYVFLSRHYQFHLGYLLLWLPRGILQPLDIGSLLFLVLFSNTNNWITEIIQNSFFCKRYCFLAFY